MGREKRLLCVLPFADRVCKCVLSLVEKLLAVLSCHVIASSSIP